MLFITDNIVRVILPDNLDCLFDVSKGSREDVNTLLSYTKVDNESPGSDDSQLNHNLNLTDLPRNAILLRLIQAN